MASRPGNPVFKECIEEIVQTCNNKYYWSHAIDMTVCTLARKLEKYEGGDFLRYLPFTHAVLPSKVFYYKDKIFFTQYEGYINDQKRNQKTNHYSTMWSEGRVFDDSVAFV